MLYIINNMDIQFVNIHKSLNTFNQYQWSNFFYRGAFCITFWRTNPTKLESLHL